MWYIEGGGKEAFSVTNSSTCSIPLTFSLAGLSSSRLCHSSTPLSSLCSMATLLVRLRTSPVWSRPSVSVWSPGPHVSPSPLLCSMPGSRNGLTLHTTLHTHKQYTPHITSLFPSLPSPLPASARACARACTHTHTHTHTITSWWLSRGLCPAES